MAFKKILLLVLVLNLITASKVFADTVDFDKAEVLLAQEVGRLNIPDNHVRTSDSSVTQDYPEDVKSFLDSKDSQVAANSDSQSQDSQNQGNDDCYTEGSNLELN